MALRTSEPDRLQRIAVGATVAGVALAAVSGFQGPWAAGAVVLFSFGLAVIDGIGKQRFSLRQAVVFLLTIGAALGAWSLAVIVLLRVVDVPTPQVVRAVLITAGACCAGALVIATVRVLVRRRVIEPVSARRPAGRATGFERSGGASAPKKPAAPKAAARHTTSKKTAPKRAVDPSSRGRAGPSPLPGSASAPGRRPPPTPPARRG